MVGLFTPAARRYIERLRARLAADAPLLERRFRSHLRRRGWKPAQIDSLLRLTAAACARAGSLAEFFAQAEQQSRRLARLQVTPEQTLLALEDFEKLLKGALDGHFGPAREQLQLATRLVLDQGFYQVRDAESRALFALSRAELEAADLDDLLRRFVGVLVRTFCASDGWLILLEPGVQRKPARPRYFRSLWSYPFGQSAVLQLAFGTPRPCLPAEEALLAAAAAHCREALERARLEHEVRRLESESRRAEEEERRRIGRELHDEAGQALMALRLELELIERAVPPDLRSRLAEARDLVARTVVELRRMVAALSPEVLERLGLEAAIRQLAARFSKVHAARLRLRLRMNQVRLPMPVQEVIYRVAQECLHNIARHSRASLVNLSLLAADKNIRLSVRDNGAGFCADQAGRKPGSFGLAGMRERAALVGGTLAVVSQPGKGTCITLELPVPAAPVVSHGKDSRSVD